METGTFRIWEETADYGRVSQVVHVSPHRFRFEVGARGVWVRPCGVQGGDTGEAIGGALNAAQSRQLALLILRETSPQTVALRRLASDLTTYAETLGAGNCETVAEALAIRVKWALQAANAESPEVEALRTLTAQLISWGRTGGASPASLHAGAQLGIDAVGETQNWALPTDGPVLGDQPALGSAEWGAATGTFGICPRDSGQLHNFVWNADGYRCAHCYILSKTAQAMQAESGVRTAGDARAAQERADIVDRIFDWAVRKVGDELRTHTALGSFNVAGQAREAWKFQIREALEGMATDG